MTALETRFRPCIRSRSRSSTSPPVRQSPSNMCSTNTFRLITRKVFMRTSSTTRGFSLLELMASMAVGVVLMGAAIQLYTQAMKATWATSQKGELQQDFRAATNLLQRDISMAGAGAMGQQGLAYNAVGLPNTATRPVYPCSTTTCNYVNGTPIAYPNSSGA